MLYNFPLLFKNAALGQALDPYSDHRPLLFMLHDQLPKEFHQYVCEDHGAEVILDELPQRKAYNC